MVHRVRQGEFNIPATRKDLRFDDLPPLHPKAVLGAAKDLVNDFWPLYYVKPNQEFADYPPNRSDLGRGLFLSGPAGSGKTSLAVATAVEMYYRWERERFFPFFARMDDLVSNHKATFGNELNEEAFNAHRFVEKAESAPLLVLDDVGKEFRSQSGWSDTMLNQLLRHRHDNGCPTIITTNSTLSEWGSKDAAMVNFIERSTYLFSMTR